MARLKKSLPLTAVVVEDVQAMIRKWNGAFSPVQCGKEHLSWLLREMGLTLHTHEGWQTKDLCEQYGLKKTKSKKSLSCGKRKILLAQAV